MMMLIQAVDVAATTAEKLARLLLHPFIPPSLPNLLDWLKEF